VIIGSFAYSLYFGRDLLTMINPWTNNLYQLGTLFSISLMSIQGAIASIEFVSEVHDFRSAFVDSSIVHEALLKPTEHMNYPTSISFRNVTSNVLKNCSFDLSGVIALVS
jgi:hypothetical protein